MSQGAHLLAGTLHGIQALYSVYVGTANDSTPKFPVKFKNTTLAQFEIWPLVTAFAGLSTINHLYTTFNYPSYRVNVLARGQNPLRWSEYGISASIMLVLVSVLCGIYEVDVLSAIFLLTGIVMMLGLLVEQGGTANAKRLFVIASVIMLVAWLFPVSSFVHAVAESERNPPAIVYSIIILMFVAFNGFAAVNWLDIRGRASGGWFGEYRNVELAYLVLSLVAKSILTNMTLFGSVLRPQDTID